MLCPVKYFVEISVADLSANLCGGFNRGANFCLPALQTLNLNICVNLLSEP